MEQNKVPYETEVEPVHSFPSTTLASTAINQSRGCGMDESSTHSMTQSKGHMRED